MYAVWALRKLRIPDNLTTLAYRTIKNYIWEGKLDEGERLTEDFVAHQLGISKSPVREALNRLETRGADPHRAPRGAYLRTLRRQGHRRPVRFARGARNARGAHGGDRRRVLVDALRESIRRMREYLQGQRQAPLHRRGHPLPQPAGECHRERAAGSKMLENVQQQIWLFRRKTYDLSGSKARGVPHRHRHGAGKRRPADAAERP